MKNGVENQDNKPVYFYFYGDIASVIEIKEKKREEKRRKEEQIWIRS